MRTTLNSVPVHISAVTLQLIATLLGLVGTALVIVQALFWIPSGHADLSVLILTACVPPIAAIVFAVAPHRAREENAQNYLLRAPMVWVNLALPVLLTLLTLLLIGVRGDLDSFSGVALLLAANAGRNLRDFARQLFGRAAGASLIK